MICLGVTGKALDWIKLYLTGRYQRIKLSDCLSTKAGIPFGVPQGAVLGALLFALYYSPLSSIISGNTIPHHHLYADDSQLYVFFASGNSAAALNGVQLCLASVQSWMLMYKLKVDLEKLKSFLSGMNNSWANISLCFLLRHLLSKLSQQNLLVILGVLFDKTFTFHSHISAVCSSCFYHAQDLWWSE